MIYVYTAIFPDFGELNFLCILEQRKKANNFCSSEIEICTVQTNFKFYHDMILIGFNHTDGKRS